MATLAAVLACDQAAAQHITIDGSLSPAQTLVGPNYAISANLGKQVGGNLFQSFGQFGLSNGESAPAVVTAAVAVDGQPESLPNELDDDEDPAAAPKRTAWIWSVTFPSFIVIVMETGFIKYSRSSAVV